MMESDPFTRLAGALADRYRIERELGQGGMATVYLAHDVRHDRRVAVKVLRPELAAILGGDRFLHEIKTTANLQHPHILSLFDSGEADGLVYYVMPYVEGESLRDRLTREKQLPVEDAVRIAREVADALQYAHEHGIVHRDIKPENILLHGGHAMVADFGIALAASRSDGGTRMTETGMSLGTPHYMSPEQSMGEREITPKADIYALGCVLYEMLTAEPPFVGATAQAIIARVMTESPRSLTLQRKSIPPHIEAAVEHALEKLPADRFATAAEFGAALSDGGMAVGRYAGRQTAATRTALPSYRRTAVPWALAALAAGAAAWGWLRRHPVQPDPVARFTIGLPAKARHANVAGGTIAMSPDGSRFAFVGTDEHGVRQLYLRSLDQLEPVPVPGTQNAFQPFFSGDGRWLGFQSGNKLMKVALAGGPALTIASADSGLLGAAWSAGDVIVMGTNGGLRQVSAAGGQPTRLTTLDTATELIQALPDFLPDGRSVLFHIRGKDGVDRLAAARLENGAVTRMAQAGSNPHYVSSGHVLLVNGDGTLISVPFDARRLTTTGPAVPITEGVLVGTGGFGKLGVSRGGTLVYATGAGGVRSVLQVDRHGAGQVLTSEARPYGSPRFSPDGRRVALEIAEASGSAIWVFDMTQKTLTRVSFDRDAGRPVWSPDGRRMAYTVQTPDPNILAVAADGSGAPESLLVKPGRQLADGWSPDGRTLLYHQNNIGSTRNDIMLLSLDSTHATRSFLATPADEFAPVFSSDGKWLAYNSDESGRLEVYVRPYPGPGGKVQVSLEGGVEPRFSYDGRELFYRAGDRVIAAAVRTAPTFSVTGRTDLFGGAFAGNQYHAQYDVAPDGRHFLMIQGPQASNDLVVVLHWFDQLRQGR